eukprot:XP_005618425.1 uncharacterized protein LOC102155853 [Canis lupus familiaris]
MEGQTRRRARLARRLPVGHRPPAWVASCGRRGLRGTAGARLSAVAPRQPCGSDSNPSSAATSGPSPASGPRPPEVTPPHGRGRSGPAHAPGPARLSSGRRGRGGAAGTLLSTALRAPPPPRAVTSPPSPAIGPGRAAAANGRLAPGAALQIFTPRRPPADSRAAAPRPRFSSFVTTRPEQLPEEGRGHRVKVLAFTRQHSPCASRGVRRCVNRLFPLLHTVLQSRRHPLLSPAFAAPNDVDRTRSFSDRTKDTGTTCRGKNVDPARPLAPKRSALRGWEEHCTWSRWPRFQPPAPLGPK